GPPDHTRPRCALLRRPPVRPLPPRMAVGRRSGGTGTEVPQRVPRHRRIPTPALASGHHRLPAGTGEGQGGFRHQLPHRRAPPRFAPARRARSRRRRRECTARRRGPRRLPQTVRRRSRVPRIGKVYTTPPQPPVEENTLYLPAGAVTFGVEYRDVDPDSLAATYADNAGHLTELEEKSAEGGFFDEGVTIHVCGTDDGHEYLRFDVFDDDPHYHYIHRPFPAP